MAGPRILTFNFHEPYLCLMAKTGYSITVGNYNDPPLSREWQTQYRGIPSNITFVDEATWRREAKAGHYDVVIAQNESNAIHLLTSPSPKLLICHNRKTFLKTTVEVDKGDPLDLYERLLQRLLERFTFIFISASKRADYGLPGHVILPGIDLDELGGYTGEVGEVLRVGNMMRLRNLMFDVDFQEAVCAGLPNRVVGTNPPISQSVESRSFEELKSFYRSRRCMLHVTREGYEDGYNLAMLEAMGVGMPIVSLANPTSPLTDGVDGFLSYDAAVLQQRIRDLLADPELARNMGEHARETVAKKFPISAFVDNWRRVIEEASEGSVRNIGQTPNRTVEKKLSDTASKRKRILMHYVASPMTTGRYFERAASKQHDVVTAGLRLPEEILAMWGFTPPFPAYNGQQIDLPIEGTCANVMSRLPQGFKPDLYLWVDSGPSKAPPDVDKLKIPTACYLIDTHIVPELRLTMAKHFDAVFLAQKGQIVMFKDAGIQNVHWLPLACSPELHKLPPMKRIYDVAFVGSTEGDSNARRRRLLDSIRVRFPNTILVQEWPENMARIYAQAKIVFNCCVKKDVNMRVFEAMASGALLVTDEATGLEDLFEDRKHLVIFREDAALPDLIAQYLEDEEARIRIAAAGTQCVLENHTYDKRFTEILSITSRTIDPAKSANEDPSGVSSRYYRNPRPDLVDYVPVGTERLFDVGCGCGDFGRMLKMNNRIQQAFGIELIERAYETAKHSLDGVLLGNIETLELPFEDRYFDCIVMADVLEHLINPTATLVKLERVLAEDGLLVLSIPNVRFYEVISMLGNGRWHYADAGIMDRTHLRFFTATEMQELIRNAGFEVLHIQALSGVAKEHIPRNPDGSISMGRITLLPENDEDLQDLLTYQYVVVAGKPNVDRLARARKALDLRENTAALLLATGAMGVDETERAKLKAKANARIGHLDDALSCYQDAITRAPDDASTLGELGILLVALNRIPEAETYLLKAHTLNPQDDRVLGAIGLVRQTQNRLEDAYACFSEALDTSYENMTLLPHYIAVADSLGRLQEVRDVVRRFAAFFPANIDIAYHYAMLLIKLDARQEALAQLQAILLFNPNHDAAQKLLQELTSSSSSNAEGT